MSDEQSARDAFVRWASRQAGAPRDPAALIDAVELSSEFAALLGTGIQGRRVVWKSVPAESRAPVGFPGRTIDSIDPWTAEPVPLRVASNHVALCHDCGGARTMTCASCGGRGKSLCGVCNGQRKMYGYASNGSRRLLNCTNCRGKGEIDCAQCRRGIASCRTCDGSGRLQRWMEIESWSRSVAQAHPPALAEQFSWNGDPSDDDVERDAAIERVVDRPYRLRAADIAGISPQWLDLLTPPLQPGERIARQRFRLARVPVTTVTYHLGSESDRVVFTGRRYAAQRTTTAFSRHVRKLRPVRLLLLTIGIVTALILLGRGTFYWSLATFCSLIAFGGALACIHQALANRTAALGRARPWLIASALLLAAGGVLTVVALPRLRHVQSLIAGGKFDAAEAELAALGEQTPAIWADLRLARVRNAAEVEQAGAALALIPKELPQHGQAVDALDALILRAPTAETLARLSSRARGTPAVLDAAEAVYVPLAQQHLGSDDWNGAAEAIVTARRLGVAPARLALLTEALHDAAADAVDAAKRQKEVDQRLQRRRMAEEILVAWERASDRWGSPELIALRTAMARDVATAERRRRR